MDSELVNMLLTTILPALAGLIATWFTVLGTQLKRKYDEKINTEIKKQVVSDVVNSVQQIYKSADGEKKLQKAIEDASLILREKGITISETEIRMLIESAVYGLNNGFNGQLIPADTIEIKTAGIEEEQEG